jgi:hypothetical protein
MNDGFANILANEFARNITGYFLVLSGISCVVWGGHAGNSVLTDMGKSLAGAALLAFQMKRTPDGNTSTTSVTVPQPAVPVPVAAQVAAPVPLAKP